MIDIEQLRTRPGLWRDSLKKRGGQVELVDQFLETDQKWKKITSQLDEIRQERNQTSRTKPDEKQRQDLSELKERLRKLADEEAQLGAVRRQLLSQMPNLLNPNVPVGTGESANKAIKTVGQTNKTGLEHDQLMEKLDWLDLQTAAKTSGSRFRYLKKEAAVAHLKLVHQAFDFALKKGFVPVITPSLVRTEILEKSGFLPFGREDAYELEDQLFLAGTSEPLLLGLNQNQTLPIDQLPLRLVGVSTCFRKEAGSYGQDVKGMFRQHQFDKVEMVSITTPEQSEKELKHLLSLQEELVGSFDLPYQVVEIGSGDLAAKESQKFDIETWFPGQKRYRETHSASNCTDYQSRGLEIRYQDGDKISYAHCLNGTLATERLLLAIIENNQQDDGSVRLPSSLAC